MSANLCAKFHLRALLEPRFEVRDATAAAMLPDGDGYQAAVTISAIWPGRCPRPTSRVLRNSSSSERADRTRIVCHSSLLSRRDAVSVAD